MTTPKLTQPHLVRYQTFIDNNKSLLEDLLNRIIDDIEYEDDKVLISITNKTAFTSAFVSFAYRNSTSATKRHSRYYGQSVF
jgi:hypothetical protein